MCTSSVSDHNNFCFLQIDFLQQKTRELERKYQDSNATKEDLEVGLSKSKITIRDQETRIKELELDLRDVDRAAKRLESDKNHVVRTADREMMEAKVWCNSIISRFSVICEVSKIGVYGIYRGWFFIFFLSLKRFEFNIFFKCFFQDELEKSRHEMEDLDLTIAQFKAVSTIFFHGIISKL